MSPKYSWHHALAAACFLAAGILIGHFSALTSSRAAILHAKFTNPLLGYEDVKNIGSIEYDDLESNLQNILDEEKQHNKITEAAVYFRDLNNGTWVGINEKADFSPSSLLKVPVMMAYLKQAETDPGLLNQDVVFPGFPAVTEQHYPPPKKLEIGKSYTILELIKQMIAYSDNDALFVLEEHIDNKLIDQVTIDLGIQTATFTSPEDYMEVKSYASLYRVLYNANYLNREMSEKALGILASSDFPKGIASGLPKEIKLADKFGERELDNDIKQLHDCGIVYYPGHPYILCIMSRGKKWEDLETNLHQISQKVYERIHKTYQK